MNSKEVYSSYWWLVIDVIFIVTWCYYVQPLNTIGMSICGVDCVFFDKYYS